MAFEDIIAYGMGVIGFLIVCLGGLVVAIWKNERTENRSDHSRIREEIEAAYNKAREEICCNYDRLSGRIDDIFKGEK